MGGGSRKSIGGVERRASLLTKTMPNLESSRICSGADEARQCQSGMFPSRFHPRPSLAPELPLTQWNVLDRARIAVNDHVVWEPVDFLFSVFVDVGITDVHGAHIFHLG